MEIFRMASSTTVDLYMIFRLISLGIAAVAITYTFYFTGLSIYRLYFHPLSKIPGPRINAITSMPIIFSLLRRRLPMEMKEFHEYYGPVVRIGPNELTFNTYTAWKDIYAHRQGHKNFPKDPVHGGPLISVGEKKTVPLLAEPDEASHARQRRVLSHAFSVKALAEQEEIVVSHIDKMISNLKRLAKEGVDADMCNWYTFLTFDLIGDLALKEKFGCLDAGEYQYWVTLLYSSILAGAYTQVTRRFAKAGSWLQIKLMLFFNTLQEHNKQHMELARLKVMQRLGNEDDSHRDFIWYILKNQERFDITEEEIIANSGLFLIAGAETTATALSAITAYLFYNPRVYEILCSEIRSTFSTANSIDHPALQKLPYLNAVIQEGLRIHPPVATGNLRMMPAGGDTVDGLWIPGGTTVSVGNWSASHNPANFRDPDAFIPERWIGDEYKDDHKEGMQPFSLGPRNCIGKNLAIMEMRLTLAHLLWHVDLKSTDGAPKWSPKNIVEKLRSLQAWDKPPLMVKAYTVQRG